MRFISKNVNLRVILKPGLPPDLGSGRMADPGISVKFLDGVLEVNDQGIIDRLRIHPGFSLDFFSVEDGEWKVPFRTASSETEPAHTITEFKYGRPDRVLSSAKAPKLSPEIEKMLTERAFEIAKGLLPDMMKEMLKAGAARRSADSEDAVSTPEVSAPSSAEVTNEVPKKKHWKTIEKEKKMGLKLTDT